ncbi:MAG TPA: YcnI family protein [Xanthobacteraceae bacterium]|nr:YcnI family protein [Xanthobacteraceae bacterium]
MSFRAFACALLALIASAATSFAHVTLTQRTAPADSYFRAVFTIPHGCEGAATTKVSIWLPESVLQAKPQVKAGWQAEIIRVALEQEVTGPHGEKITQRVAKVVFSGGSIPDDHIDEFVLQLRLPKEAGTLYFPVEQECGDKRLAWREIPASNQTTRDLANPAAMLTVTPKP